MPRNTRQWARRKLQQVEGLIDNCCDHLVEIADVYHEQQPQIAENLVDIGVTLKQISTAAEHLRKVM